MKSICQAAVLLALGLVASLQLVRAQEVDGYVGFGTARAGSNGQQIDTFSDGTLHATGSLDGAFTDWGANVLFGKQFGVGWTGSWKFSSGPYAGLGYHANFQVFDGIYQPGPIRTKRFVPELRAGLGLASVRFDFNDPVSCSQVPGCPDDRFFLAHMAVAARFYISNHVFLRPAVDVHFVHDFYPFGSNWVPRYSMSVGYSFGRE
ncbi:MAG TPA: hypothetical protein VG096_06980 [Bryobacteraceae bacterium]|nr:hypothetical protein [Bryobacteraceae bacterium]